MYSLVVKNAMLIDGTGQPGEVFDIAINEDKIVNISKNISTASEFIIDASGKVLSPGFIDVQNHSDVYWQLLDKPDLSSLVSQGYTTVLVGNCGASLAPLLNRDGLLAIQKWHNLDAANLNWQSFAEFINELSKKTFGCNVASLVGYSTIRRALVGDQVRRLTEEELKIAKTALQDSLDAGAFGLSTGLSYSHEIIISEIELFELAKILKQSEALLAIHLRSEGGEIVEAVDEALDIARNAKINLIISHLKVRNEQNFHKFPEVVGLIETAYHQGLNVHFDVYPYDTVWQPLYTYLPKWAIEGGRTLMLKHFADPVQKNKILMYLNNSGVKFSTMMIASTASKLQFTGKTVGQIAKNLEVSSEQAVLHIISNGGSEVLVFEKNLDSEQVRSLVLHPLSFVATDGGGFNFDEKDRLVHPRCFGTATKFLNSILQTGELNLEQAIKKITSGPAKKIGLQNRGEIKIGNFADFVIFDPKIIADKATYENPYQPSVGIEYVFVNGRAEIVKGKPTGKVFGRALKKN